MSEAGPEAGRPARVRVTGPAAGRRPRTPVTVELDEQSRLGEVYLRSLMRSQLRLAVGLTVVLVASVGALPLLFSGPLHHARVGGVPVAWWLLGVGCYPVLIVLAVVYVRRAETNERRFTDLVGPGAPEAHEPGEHEPGERGPGEHGPSRGSA